MDAIKHEPGTAGWTKALIFEITGSAVVQLSAPGGLGRKSVRANLDDGRSVIATRRETQARGETEAGLLQVLSAEGAPVPQVLGFRDGLMVQQDVGRNRLSYAMVHATPDARIELGRAALDALATCRSAIANRPDILAKLPGLGTRRGWAEDFVSQPFFLSGDLGIARPDVDAAALGTSLAHEAQVFTRWDARLANAAVQPDGHVIWYDWDLVGLRAGVEDYGWALADEYWQIPVDASLALLDRVVPDPDKRGLALRMAVLVGADRLKRITARLDAQGWSDPAEVLRLDRIGTVSSVITDLTKRMAQLAAHDPLTQGFGPWFQAAGAAIVSRVPVDRAG